MTALSALLDAPAATTLAWTLLHFLWQGAGLAAALLLAIRYARLAAAHRYAAGVATLALMLAAPIVTFSVLSGQQSSPRPGAGSAVAAPPAAQLDIQAMPVDLSLLNGEPGTAGLRDMSIGAIVVAVWAAGVLVLATRLLGGWWFARRLVRRISPVAPEIESMAVRLAGRLALDRVVRIAQSSAVAVPVMVGWFKPVVLFPASVLSGLSATQIEALLAHELAHVRRHDYLVNLLQSVVETLLFYHPAVWWVSKRVRVEREHCCDDIALSVCDRLVYATALSDLAALAQPPQVALAATGGSLLQRVRRILAADDGPERGAGWLPVIVAMAIAAVLVPAAIVASEDAPAEWVSEQTAGGVSGGVAGGVAGGVPSGVAGGALDEPAASTPPGQIGGVAGGVPGGVAGGVPGGVDGGVPGGMVGGVQGGVTSNEQAARAMEDARALYELLAEDGKLQRLYALLAEANKQRPNAEREVEQLRRQAELRLRELERERQQLEQARLDARYRAERAALEAEFKALDEQRTRIKRQVETGTMSPTELAQVEGQLVLLQHKLQAIQTEFELDRRELELRRQQAEQMRELERVMAERHRENEEVVARDQLARQRTAEARIADETLSQLREHSNTIERLKQAGLLEAGVTLDDSAMLRAGDILIIEIHGEPDVPRAYTVGADGTIRLPLSRPVKVAGRTTAEVRQDIVKQLTARGLERVDVEVTPRRPRGEK